MPPAVMVQQSLVPMFPKTMQTFVVQVDSLSGNEQISVISQNSGLYRIAQLNSDICPPNFVVFFSELSLVGNEQTIDWPPRNYEAKKNREPIENYPQSINLVVGGPEESPNFPRLEDGELAGLLLLLECCDLIFFFVRSSASVFVSRVLLCDVGVVGVS